MNRFLFLPILGGILLGMPHPVIAAEQTTYTIVIKDHRFVPAEQHVPAGQKLRLVIDNQDPTPEEFESYDLDREKVVSGNSQIIVFIGPLKAGAYSYFGDFSPETAQGTIIAE